MSADDQAGVPADILKQASVEEKDVLYFASSDIGDDGGYGTRWLLVTRSQLIVVGSGVRRFDLARVSEVDVVDHLGMGELVLSLDGKEVAVISFSRSRVKDFRKAVVLISELIQTKGHPLYLKVERPRKQKHNVYAWLFSFISPYKLKLVLALLFSVIGVLVALVPPYLISLLIDRVFQAKQVSLFVPLVLAALGSYVAGILLGIGSSYLLSWFGLRIMADMRDRVYAHLQALSLDFYDRMNSGRILSRVVDDVGRMQWFLSSGLQSFAVNLLTMIGIGAIIFLMDWKLALFVLIPIPVIAIGIPLYRRRAHAVYHKAWRKWADVDTLLVDTIPGVVVVKSFSQEPREVERLKGHLDQVVSSNMSAVSLNLRFFPVIALATSASAVLMWYIGGLQVMSGTLALGTLVAFTMYMGQFYGPVNALTNLVQPMQQAMTSAERVMEIMDEQPAVTDGPDAVDLKVRGEIRFEGVSFGYEPYLPVVYDLNFSVPAGSTVGVVGPSGAGKTTLTKLIMRFYDPQSGTIYVDGVDLRKVRRSSWRRQVGIVLQDPFLFDGSVAYNISYGLERVDPERIVAAARAAAAHDFVMKLPLAYDSWVGERGSSLSGGERQRISIARAIITDPRVLIMDEATSSVDSITEKKIQSAVNKLVKDRTTIIIAHRLSTVKGADQILVMDHGTVVEKGTHEELMRLNGLYARMYRAQYEEEEALSLKAQTSTPGGEGQ